MFFFTIERRIIMNKRIEKVKDHIKEHQVVYCCTVTGVIVAGITAVIMRSRSDFSIQRGIAVLAKRGLAVPGETSVNALEVNRGGLVLGNSYALNNVSFISSNRTGSPSWVVRCLETGEIFTSQLKAASEMNVPASDISKHLNGILDHVRGYHFERICMAA
jgi:hypothetical protein